MPNEICIFFMKLCYFEIYAILVFYLLFPGLQQIIATVYIKYANLNDGCQPFKL